MRSEDSIQQAENKLNKRPGKRLKCQTHIFVMNRLLFSQKLHLLLEFYYFKFSLSKIAYLHYEISTNR